MRRNTFDENQVKDIFKERLAKVARLTVFATDNGYNVSNDIIERLRSLDSVKDQEQETKEKLTELDLVQAELTSLTYPITAETLSLNKQSEHYLRFRNAVIVAGVVALVFAITSIIFIVFGLVVYAFSSILAFSLGLFGAAVYSLPIVLKVATPQAFDFNDECVNYMYLVLGGLIGWLVYFAFYVDEFAKMSWSWQTTLGLFIIIIAGFFAKFLLSILRHAINTMEGVLQILELGVYALEVVLKKFLGIREKYVSVTHDSVVHRIKSAARKLIRYCTMSR